VTAVESRGKHLLVRFAAGPVLHTHLRMRGSWHLYRPGSAWRRPPRAARVVVETPEAVAVCFAAPVVELLSPAEEAAHPVLRALGPDVMAPGFPVSAVVERLRAHAQAEIGEALLDQTLVAGVGNIYKSETLFACGVDPFAPVATLDDPTLDAIARTAERLMKRGPRPRAVYGRAGRPCRRCGTLILMRRQGPMGRSTYWCPRCQPRPPVMAAARMTPSRRAR
jgi:endonuclease-8